MCISATVSFSLSGLLLLTGTYCVAKAAHGDRRMMPLAVVPLVFCIQQLCEGFVWVGINQSSPRLLKVSALLFLFFALLFWLIWIPFSTLSMEPRKNVRTILRVITLSGAILGGCLYLPILMRPDWLTVETIKHSVYYNIGASPILGILPSLVWQLLYLAIVAVPLLVSPDRRIFHLGMAVVLSAAASHVFFSYAAASIWCFFAAALSIYLCRLFFTHPVPSPAATST